MKDRLQSAVDSARDLGGFFLYNWPMWIFTAVWCGGQLVFLMTTVVNNIFFDSETYAKYESIVSLTWFVVGGVWLLMRSLLWPDRTRLRQEQWRRRWPLYICGRTQTEGDVTHTCDLKKHHPGFRHSCQCLRAGHASGHAGIFMWVYTQHGVPVDLL